MIQYILSHPESSLIIVPVGMLGLSYIVQVGMVIKCISDGDYRTKKQALADMEPWFSMLFRGALVGLGDFVKRWRGMPWE